MYVYNNPPCNIRIYYPYVAEKNECFRFHSATLYCTCIAGINECSNNNGGCEDVCVDTEGSYFCECDGADLADDNHNCTCNSYY